MSSTVALIELNALDEQDQQELDRLELGEFLRKQPQLPRPSAASSLPPPISPTPRVLSKKRKRSVRQEEGGSSSLCKRPVGEVSEPEVAPKVCNRKHKRPAGQSWDAEVPDYCRVVLVLRPPFVDTSGSVPMPGGCVDEVGRSSGLLAHQRSNSPGESPSFLFSDLNLCLMPVSQCSPDVPHPFPQAQATAALKAENETLRAKVADLRKLLETSRAETSTLTSLLRDTTTSLDDHNKDLEASRRALQDVTADRLEYGHVLAQFRAIEAEL
ncbi:hypothetical protein F5879DRAFT_995545 [Lentinula edodes]|nr:hypothetical protein F5879DRAFT_995545 [Lentinula edodes]